MIKSLKEAKNVEKWYADAEKYWESVDANIDGMLGGYSHLSEIDAKASLEFISRFQGVRNHKACDCGAGIGRVTKSFLLYKYDRVDLVEPSRIFLDKARSEFKKEGQLHRVNFIQTSLQNFVPSPGYDLIWSQWVLSHLTDDDLVSFFLRCKETNPEALIGIKENIAKKNVEFDEIDSSCTRSDEYFKLIFLKCNLILLGEETQRGFPTDLYVVKMYILK